MDAKRFMIRGSVLYDLERFLHEAVEHAHDANANPEVAPVIPEVARILLEYTEKGTEGGTPDR